MAARIAHRFDLAGEHKQTEPLEIWVVEYLYRWTNWKITAHSDPFVKKDAHTIEFRVHVNPNQQRTITYTVHYSW